VHVVSGGVARAVGRCAPEGADGFDEDDGRAAAAATDVEGPVRDAGDGEAEDAARLGRCWEHTVQRHVANAGVVGRHLRVMSMHEEDDVRATYLFCVYAKVDSDTQ
jgi:hypothetical protein